MLSTRWTWMALFVADWVTFLLVSCCTLFLLHIGTHWCTLVHIKMCKLFTWAVVQCSFGTTLHSCRWIVVHTFKKCSHTLKNNTITDGGSAAPLKKHMQSVYLWLDGSTDVVAFWFVEALVVLPLVRGHLNHPSDFAFLGLGFIVWRARCFIYPSVHCQEERCIAPYYGP